MSRRPWRRSIKRSGQWQPRAQALQPWNGHHNDGSKADCPASCYFTIYAQELVAVFFSNSSLVYSSVTGFKDVLRLPHGKTHAHTHTHTLMCFTSHKLLTTQLNILDNECQYYTCSYRQLRNQYSCMFDVGNNLPQIFEST